MKLVFLWYGTNSKDLMYGIYEVEDVEQFEKELEKELDVPFPIIKIERIIMV